MNLNAQNYPLLNLESSGSSAVTAGDKTAGEWHPHPEKGPQNQLATDEFESSPGHQIQILRIHF